MMTVVKKRAIPLGRVFSIPIRLDLSWLLAFALVTWSLATSYYPEQLAEWPSAQYWIVGAVTAITLFVSVLLHELGHSVVAMLNDVPVRRITLFIFGGVAEIAGEPASAAAEFGIAVAGPIVSAALAGLFYVLKPVVSTVEPLLGLVQYMAVTNLALALFNLIPGFPLDGGRVLRAIIWAINGNLRKATHIAASVGRMVGFLFIGLGAWRTFGGNLANGLWLAFIGWFLESAAGRHIQMQRVRELLSEYTVSQAMSQNYAFVPTDITLQSLVDHHILGSGQRSFIVKQHGKSVGLLTISRPQSYG
jgi:Zn-dependent protease